MFDRVKRAWAVWMLANGSYGCMLNDGYDLTGGTSKKLANKRADFKVDYASRLQQVQIECADALRIIGSRDTEETFFYLDPPYVGTDQGHYDGYTQMDFDALLERLEAIRGKFLLSSFRNAALAKVTRKNGWHTVEVRLSSSMTHGRGRAPRDKVEVLTANYPVKGRRSQRESPKYETVCVFGAFSGYAKVRRFQYE
jgi:DNA adenine methylase